IWRDLGDDHARNISADAELAARLVVEFAHRHAEDRRGRDRAAFLSGRRAFRLGEFFAFLESPERDLDRRFDALADDDQIDDFSDRAFGHDQRQFAALVDILAIEFDDDVTDLDDTVVDRPALDDSRYKRALGDLDAQAFGDLVGHR